MMAEDWRPSASLEVLRSRAGMLERIRAYFAAQEVHEVQTPALSAAAVSDPAIESVAAEAQGMQSWLQTSPEYPMKRLLAAGFGDCYQVCPVFRAGESGRLHNPEFTLIEWYRLEFGVGEMEHDVDRLLRVACAELRSFAPARAIAYRAAMLEGSGVDCTSAQVPEIRAALAARGIEPAQSSGRWDRDEWLDLLMGAVVGPGLGHDAPVFVHDYPPAQASLARLRAGPDGTQVAERFELYVDGLELANGFRELGDSGEQRRRFEQDQATRRRRGQPLRPLDERLLAALAAGLPDCAGVALGFDRLVMAALRLPSLDAAMAFPFARA